MDDRIRINKYISMSGVCSRRAADELIAAGRVEINGQAAEQGSRAGINDIVTVDGIKITVETDKKLYAFYKPAGYISSLSDEQGEGIGGFIPEGERLFPIGRLDRESEGLMLLTNDGMLMNEILNAANGHEKEYVVTTREKITDDFLKRMSKGVPITNAATHERIITAPCKTYRVSDREFGIILIQGLNRQIRRMCGYFNYNVEKLVRTRIMNITLKGLLPGRIIKIENSAYDELKKAIER